MNNLQEKVIRAMVDMYGFYSIEELSEMTEISISSIKRSLKDITKFIEDYDGKTTKSTKKRNLHGGDRSAERKYFGST